MTYSNCKKIIEKGTYASKEEMQEKLDVFYLNNRLSQDQYSELTQMLSSK